MSGPEYVYVVQTRMGFQEDEWAWCWDLNDVHATLEAAETERAEFYFEDKMTRIVKMKLVEVDVVHVFELPVEKPAGVLF